MVDLITKNISSGNKFSYRVTFIFIYPKYFIFNPHQIATHPIYNLLILLALTYPSTIFNLPAVIKFYIHLFQILITYFSNFSQKSIFHQNELIKSTSP